MANLYQDAQASATQGAQDMNDIFSQVAAINSERAASAASAAKDQELVTATQALSAAKQQRQALDLATKMGTNPDASNEVLTSLISDKNALFQTARDNLRKINAARNTSLFSDPGAWLAGNLNLEKDTNNYNAAADEYNLVGKRIDDVVSSTDDIVKMTKGIQISVTDASAEAAARVASQQLLDASNAARIDSLKSNAEGIQRVQALKQTALSNAVQQQQLGMEAQRLALAKQSAAMEQQRMSLAFDEKKENRDEQARTIQAVNIYRKTNGMPEVSWTDLKLLYKDPQQKQIIDQQITGGLTIAQTGGRYLADTPSNAMIIAGSNGAQLPTGPASLVSTANNVLQKLKTDPQVIAAKLNPLQVQDLLNTRMKTMATDEQKEITAKNSLYILPSMTTMLSDPSVAQTASAKIVLSALATSGVKDFNPTQVIPLILESAKKGEMTLDQAISDITFLGNKAVGYNNAHFSYDTTMGLPKMVGFPVRLETTSGLRAAGNTVADTINGLFGNTEEKSVPYITKAANLANPLQATAIGTASAIQSVFGGKSSELMDITNPAKVQDYANRYFAGKISANLKQQAAANSNKASTK